MREIKSTVVQQDRRITPEFLSTSEMLEYLLFFVRRHRYVILGTTSAFILLGVAFLFTMPPTFTATATLLVEGRDAAQLYPQQTNPTDMAAVQNQVAIIESEDLATRIINALHLAKDPDFTGESALTRLRVLSDRLFGRRSLQADLDPHGRALRAFAQRLTAKAVPASRVVNISFRSNDPERAAQIANAVAEASITAPLEARSWAAAAAGRWLQERLAELRGRAEAAEQELAAFKGRSDIDNQPMLHMLESSARAYRSEYDDLLRRELEWTHRQEFPLAEARVISRASPQSEKASLGTPRVLAVAVTVGVIAGFALALLRQLRDRTLRSGRDVEAALDADCIALIPKTKRAVGHPLRAMKFGARLSDLTLTNKVIGVASALPGEGRTTVALALGHLLSRIGHRTILVDFDFRNSQLSRLLCPDQCNGVVDILERGVAFETAVCTDAKTGLTALAAGNCASGCDDVVLNSPRLRKLLERLRAQYDAVVIDLPPLAPLYQTEVGPDLVDGYILVVEWGRTNVRAVQGALREARGIHQSLLGVILNKVNLRRLRRHDPRFAQYRDRGTFVRRRAAA